jgi:hydrogenase maturation protease
MTRASRALLSDSAPATYTAGERVPVTVVGIGNEFRGDDAVGLTVVRQLKERVPAGARTFELTGDQTYLLELMRSTDALIMVDAVQSSAPAGTIFRIDASEEPAPKEFLSFSTHAVDSTAAIELARTLGLLPGRILIYGIVGKGFSFSTTMTAEVKETIDMVQERILGDIECILSEGYPGKRENCRGNKS